MAASYSVLSGFYRPRQFEFNPAGRDEILFGTLSGEMCVSPTKFASETSGERGETTTLPVEQVRYLGNFGGKRSVGDAILGICWLRRSQDKFVTGSSDGRVCLGTTDPTAASSVVKTYREFKNLTSIHVNSENTRLLVSGYTKDAYIYDLETGGVVANYKDVHDGHVNISRFCNMSPNIFATSSFDCSCKLFDLRLPHTAESRIYSVKCTSGVVMINFSPDDTFLLASALDNEITQFLTVDGREHTKYTLPKTGLEGNFTRAYYSSTGSYVVTGACEEQHVRILCAASGEVLSTSEIYPQRKHSSLYIQSLRGAPHNDESFAVLANYKDLPNRELVFVQLPRAVPLDDSLSAASLKKEEQGDGALPQWQVEGSAIRLPSPALPETMATMRRDAASVPVSLRLDLLSSYTSSSSSSFSSSSSSSSSSLGAALVLDEDAASAAHIDCVLCTGLSSGHVFATCAHLFVLRLRCRALCSLIDEQMQLQQQPRILILCIDGLLASVDGVRKEVLCILLEYLYCGDAAADIKPIRLACLDSVCPQVTATGETLRSWAFLESLIAVESNEANNVGEEEPENNSGSAAEFEKKRNLLLRRAVLDETFWRTGPASLALIALVEQVLLAAKALDTERLISKCELIVLRCLLPCTVSTILRLSDSHELPRVRARCLHYLTYHRDVCHVGGTEGSSLLSTQTTALRLAASIPALKLRQEAVCMSPAVYKRRLAESAALNLGSPSNASLVLPPSPPHGNQDMEEDGEDLWEDDEDDDEEDDEEEEEEEEDMGAPNEEEGDDNLQLWQRREENGSRWVAEFPRYVGHAAVPGPAPGLVLVIGGKERTRYHFPRLVAAYSTVEAIFTMLDAADGTARPSGAAADANIMHAGVSPDNARESSIPSLLFHAAAPAQQNLPQHIVVVGGLIEQERRPNEKARCPVLVLDCATMTWTRPLSIGAVNLADSPGSGFSSAAAGSTVFEENRLRHTLCAMYPDLTLLPPSPTPLADRRLGSPAAEVMDVLSQRFCHSNADVDCLSLPATNLMSVFIVFGGVSADQHHPTFLAQLTMLVVVAPPQTQTQTQTTTSARPLFSWVRPKLAGVQNNMTMPSARFHHAACILHLSEARGGARQLVYGGLGGNETHTDLRSLRLGKVLQPGPFRPERFSSPTVGDVCAQWSVEWEEVTLSGRAPSERFGHSMTTVRTQDGDELVVIVGGSLGNFVQAPLDEVYVLHVTDSTGPRVPGNFGSSISLRWEKALFSPIPGLLPPPRMLHTALSLKPGSLLVFGGGDGRLNQMKPLQSQMLELVLQRRADGTTEAGWHYYSNRLSGGSAAHSLDAQLEVKSEPTIALSADCLYSDLLRLFRQQQSLQSDADVRIDLVSGGGRYVEDEGEMVVQDTASSVYANQALISRRSNVFATMLSWEQERLQRERDNEEDNDVNAKAGPIVLSFPDDDEPAEDETAEQRTERVEARRRVFASMVEFLYTDTLQCQREEDVTALLCLANRNDLPRLSQLCEYHLARLVTTNIPSLGMLLQFADFYSLETLKAVCFANILRLGWSGDGPSGVALGLSELSTDLKAELHDYRMNKRHAYLYDHQSLMNVA